VAARALNRILGYVKELEEQFAGANHNDDAD
jgi:hypothetical protein